MTDLAALEYASLRATIQSRSLARPLILMAGIVFWAALLLALLIWLPQPVTAAVPLLVLATTFEVVRSLHLGIERIGRYVQTFFEEDAGDEALFAPPSWERTAMTFGPTVPGAGGHPLYLPIFILATSLNLLAVMLPEPVLVEMAAMAVPHSAFVVWMLYCDRAMRRQRIDELARFRSLKAAPPSTKP
jgi:hypothetical protein